ncbi:MAG: hypothetical protein ACREGJ_04165 [Candidatus Saccharimonadales bacterium]
MMRKLFVALMMVVSVSVLAPQPASAAVPSQLTHVACGKGVANFLGFKTWDSCLKQKYGKTKIENVNDIWLIVLPILEDVIKAAGYTAVGFIIWGAIKYIKSQGEPAEINTARMIITNAVIGLIICVISVAIVQFVAGTF